MDKKQFDEFMGKVGKNQVIFFDDSDFIATIIDGCEKLVNKKARLSHVLIIGSNGMCYESTVENIFNKDKKVWGSIKRPIAERFTMESLKDCKSVIIQTLKFTDEEWQRITDYFDTTVGKVKYGFLELIGTLLKNIKYNYYKTRDPDYAKVIRKEYNIFDTDDHEYCIAYVDNGIYHAIEKKYIVKADESSTIVDDGLKSPYSKSLDEI
jgi:hypothetical protein